MDFQQAGQQVRSAGNGTRPSSETPPGFTSATTPFAHQCGIGHGELVGARKTGWEMLLPTGPTTTLTPQPALNITGPEVAAPRFQLVS